MFVKKFFLEGGKVNVFLCSCINIVETTGVELSTSLAVGEVGVVKRGSSCGAVGLNLSTDGLVLGALAICGFLGLVLNLELRGVILGKFCKKV